mgnify:CR=1 FL=1
MYQLLKITTLTFLMTIMGCSVDDTTDAEKYSKPTVNAGSDQLHTLPLNRVTLRGSAKTYPEGVFSIKTKRWTQISGPQQLSILNRDELTATLINLETAGTYVFELYAKDSIGRTNTDKVRIVVQPPVQVENAQKTQGYDDDYEVMWNMVAEEYVHYSDIEQEWNRLYQHNLYRSYLVSTQNEWKQLLQDMVNELSHSEPTAKAAEVSSQSSETPTVIWGIHNGKGMINFNNIGRMPLDQIEKHTSAAIHNLTEVAEIELHFIGNEPINQQASLSLISLMTANATRICVRDRQEPTSCVEILENPLLTGKVIKVKADGENRHLSALNNYLSLHGQGVDIYVVEPLLPIIR